VWQRRFGGDPDVVGRDVRLGNGQSRVVGVMPEGFAFPVSHSAWVPFRVNAPGYGRREGPSIYVFGRLAPGVTFEQAQAELSTLGRRASADFPDTHEHLRPRVIPYAQLFWELTPAFMYGMKYAINLFFVMLLALVSANVALLMFARAATREGEIVVRNALGASRGRIIMQLFAEALVLVGAATVAGLAAAGYALKAWLSVSRAEPVGGCHSGSTTALRPRPHSMSSRWRCSAPSSRA
jgi:putative ABC transport system permease protein